MHYLYRYVCILNVFFIYVYEQLSAIKNLYIIIIVFSYLDINQLGYVKQKCGLWWSAHS